jgi:hypothetical protein
MIPAVTEKMQINSKETSSRSTARYLRQNLPALALALNLGILGPAYVYLTNPGEFLISLGSMTGRVLLAAGFGIWVLFAMLARLPGRAGRGFLLLTLLLVFASYVHGNLLLWDTGVLDGAPLGLGDNERNAIDAVLWIALALLVWSARDWMWRRGWTVCLLLLAFQGAGLIQPWARQAALAPTSYSDMPDSLAQFSEGSNVVHLVLDGFQGSIFSSLLEDHPAWREGLSGFTFFPNATTPSSVTYLSVPAALTGVAFRNDRPISTYHEETLGSYTLYDAMRDAGYLVEVASPVSWNAKQPGVHSHYRIPTPFLTEARVTRREALLLLDISLFRQAPHFLKPDIYRSGTWLLSSMDPDPELSFKHFSHRSFLRKLIDKAEAIGGDPRYKFIHLITPHPPLVSGPNCEYSGAELDYSLDAFKIQSACTFDTVLELLGRMKDMGVYRDSLILIHGDHGGGVGFPMLGPDGQTTTSGQVLNRIWGSPQPLVLIKQPAASGALAVSTTPVALTDVPATVSDILGSDKNWPGEPMFGISADSLRDRYYYRSSMHRNDAAAKDRFDDFDTFRIRGSIFDAEAWEQIESWRVPGLDERDKYSWGTRLTFGRHGNFKPFLSGGWSLSNRPDVTWTNSPVARLELPFAPSPGPVVILRADVKPFLAPGKLTAQRLIIRVQQETVARLELSENRFQTIEAVIPAHLLRTDGVTRIAFETPDAATPAALGVSADTRQLGVGFRALQFEVASPPD